MIFPYWYYLLPLFFFTQPQPQPTDWFYKQRAFPFDTIPQQLYHSNMKQIQAQKKSSTRSALQQWQFAGPTNIGGRITDLEGSTTDPNLIYVGSASGGIFKTINGGLSWQAIFDQQPMISIGDMAVQISNPAVIYAGTGEANGGGGSVAYDGNGIFKSNDGGNTWIYLGLEFSGSISKILIHPTQPEIVYAAAMGKLFGKNDERGVFKSTNGGNTWEKVFFLADSVGVIDLAMDPRRPDTLYAATWERSRKASGINYGGEGSGIYRSFDGGKVWTKLTNGLPDGTDLGRIGLAVAPSEPNKVYAFYVDASGDFLGVYRSNNAGNDWFKLSGKINAATFGWWFGKIYVDPQSSNNVYGLGLTFHKSVDGGNLFYSSSDNLNEDVHVDQHALYIYPGNPKRMLLGNDGGLYISENAGDNWTKINNLPITQFYTCHIDYSQPQRLYGGTQDNSCIRTLSGDRNGWEIFTGGDGFVCLVDPLDNRYVYAESQYGVFYRSTDGGYSFSTALEGIQNDRKNWNTPVIFHPHDPKILFLGTDRLYRSDNRAVAWTSISPVFVPPTGSRIYGTITTISVSPIDPKIIYCGTDVGLVWMTLDGGTTWKPINDNIPARWITSIAADPHQKNKVYLTISGYRYNENLAHVYLSSNYGVTWQDISRGLPPIPCNKIIIDPQFPGHLVVATDGGTWRSNNDGRNWQLLGDGLPPTIATDLYLHAPTRKLAVSTYGRGMYTYNLELPVSNKTSVDELMTIQAYPNPTLSDQISVSIQGLSGKGFQLSIMHVNGQLLSIQSLPLLTSGTSVHEVKLPEQSGVYFLSLSSPVGVHRTIRVLKY